MSNKPFRVILPLVILSLLIGLNTSCTYFSPIVGKWQDNSTGYIMEFTRDGKIIINADNYVITGTYQLVSGDVVNLSLEGDAGNLMGMTGSNSFQFKISGNAMTMEGGGGSGVLYRVQNPTTPKIIRTTTIKTSATNSNPAIVIAYPKGGEIWHVGETVTIKWTSTNLPKTAQLNISIVFPIVGESIGLPINGTNTVSNTGSYDWTIPKSISGYSIIGTKDEIDIDNINVPNNNGINVTYNSGYLTITN